MEKNEEDEFLVTSLTEDRLEDWFDHLAFVFEKAPRSYFVRHWKEDPNRNLEGMRTLQLKKGIKVVFHKETKQILCTLRIFKRELFLNGKSVPLSGIGEVSARPEWRGRHLASRLLKWAAEEIATSDSTFSASLGWLHTSSAVPLYRGLGWTSVPRHLRRYSLSYFDQKSNSQIPSDPIRKVDWTNEEDVKMLVESHETIARMFNGPIVRSLEYWNQWIRSEANILPGYQVSLRTKGSYIHFLLKNNWLHLNDFGDRNQSGESLLPLLLEALKEPWKEKVEGVILPESLLSLPKVNILVEEGQLQVDEGTMFLQVDSSLGLLPQVFPPEKHLFWGIDSF